MTWSLRWRLSLMMFLQYAIWGAWEPVFAAHLEDNLKLTGSQIGYICSLLPLACIVSPFLFAQIADRYFSTQRILAVLHFVGGAICIIMAGCLDFESMYLWMAAYAFFYAPTLALTNSLTFHHLENVERDFGIIRVMGTIGWAVAGFALSGVRTHLAYYQGDCLITAGVCSILMSGLCVLLPHTPPNQETEDPWAFLKAFRLFKVPGFTAFMGISFVVATGLQFYYIFTGPFLEHSVGIAKANVPAVMTIGQLGEIVVMAFLMPYMLPRIGVRSTLAIGVFAWALRYVIFAIGGPMWLVVLSLTLHGFCYVFFFTVGQVYVNAVAPPDIRASAQSVLILFTLGIGRFLGSLFTGWTKDFFTTGAGENAVTNYTGVFLVPCALTIACAFAFFLFFKDPARKFVHEDEQLLDEQGHVMRGIRPQEDREG